MQPKIIFGFSERRSEEHTSELQSRRDLVCRLLLEKKKQRKHRERESPPSTMELRQPKAYHAHEFPLWVLGSCGRRKRSRQSSRSYFFFFNGTATPRVHPFSPPGGLPD